MFPIKDKIPKPKLISEPERFIKKAKLIISLNKQSEMLYCKVCFIVCPTRGLPKE